jgi:hypothetical protein
MYPDTLPRCLHTLDLLVLDQSPGPGTSSHDGSGAGLPAAELPGHGHCADESSPSREAGRAQSPRRPA